MAIAAAAGYHPLVAFAPSEESVSPPGTPSAELAAAVARVHAGLVDRAQVWFVSWSGRDRPELVALKHGIAPSALRQVTFAFDLTEDYPEQQYIEYVEDPDESW